MLSERRECGRASKEESEVGSAGSPAVYGNVCTGAMRCGKAENEIDLVLRSGGTPLPIVCDCVRICTHSGHAFPALATVSVTFQPLASLICH